ncbi:hypothetical protein Hanom_Chr11g01005771 [Helianthus anomalus]
MFQIWTKVAKVTKPQGPKWQFTLVEILLTFCRFLELSSTLEHDRPTTTNKLTILGDTL